jgi:hypothetical protein
MGISDGNWRCSRDLPEIAAGNAFFCSFITGHLTLAGEPETPTKKIEA